MTLDRRLTLARPDLADAALRGLVEAERFVEPIALRVRAPVADLRREPRFDAPIDTQALMGEGVRVIEHDVEGWSFGRLDRDGYVGWLPADALGPAEPRPTHRVRALRTFLHPGPDLRSPALGWLSLGARVAAAGERDGWIEVAGAGFLHAAHCAPLDAPPAEDPAAIAESLVGAPYLWGGKTTLGLDCSGLVQIALHACGIDCPRDSDQQAALGEPVAEGAPLARGDLVFWRGHVGILADAETLVHANGHHRAVAREPLAQARARILEKSYGPVVAVRRLALRSREAGDRGGPPR